MIPHRMLNRENSGVAVKYRVAACRKRLRTVRALRTQISHSTDDEFHDAEISAAEILPAGAIETDTESLVGSNLQLVE